MTFSAEDLKELRYAVEHAWRELDHPGAREGLRILLDHPKLVELRKRGEALYELWASRLHARVEIREAYDRELARIRALELRVGKTRETVLNIRHSREVAKETYERSLADLQAREDAEDAKVRDGRA